MTYLSFNILTLNHPLKELVFYFTNQEEDNLTRIYKSLVPNEAIVKYGEQDQYYTSFTRKLEVLAAIKPITEALQLLGIYKNGKIN